jgi:hypothetical protein
MGKRAPVDVGSELRAWLDLRGWTEDDLAQALAARTDYPHVSQSWISRICTGDFKRFSGKTGAVLKYANIRVDNERARDVQGERIIGAAVAEAWDGSVGGAKALARVLRSAAALARETKAQRRP